MRIYPTSAAERVLLREVKAEAALSGVSLGDWVIRALKSYRDEGTERDDR